MAQPKYTPAQHEYVDQVIGSVIGVDAATRALAQATRYQEQPADEQLRDTLALHAYHAYLERQADQYKTLLGQLLARRLALAYGTKQTMASEALLLNTPVDASHLEGPRGKYCYLIGLNYAQGAPQLLFGTKAGTMPQSSAQGQKSLREMVELNPPTYFWGELTQMLETGTFSFTPNHALLS